MSRLLRRLVDALVPPAALAWDRLDGYLPPAPDGWAWYMHPIDRPATEAERLRGVTVDRHGMHGFVQLYVTVGWRYELGQFPPVSYG